MCLVLSLYYCEDNDDNRGQLFVWQLKSALSELSVLSSYLFKTTMTIGDNFFWCKIVFVVFIYIYNNRDVISFFTRISVMSVLSLFIFKTTMTTGTISENSACFSPLRIVCRIFRTGRAEILQGNCVLCNSLLIWVLVVLVTKSKVSEHARSSEWRCHS